MAIFAINTEKQETGINVIVTNITEVKAFVDWCLLIYKKKGCKGFDLQESFIDNFKLFIKEIFNNLGKD